ncbi:hypothetical protein KR222_001098 [Zaprionus bogoriensis]|nr:hypothetical protein KR222_001098 [Zaprionus bogoriensis]
MEQTFSITPWKYALFTTCILISLLNIFFFSCGVVIWGSATSVYGGYAAALCGVSIFASAFFGVYVALKESYKYSVYVSEGAATVITIFHTCSHSPFVFTQYIVSTILVIALLATYFFTYTSMRQQLLRQFDDRVRRLYDEKSYRDDTMQPIHSLFRCCGLDGPQDYLSNGQGALPASCCYSADCSDPENINEEGCIIKGARLMKLQSEINYYACIFIFGLEFLGLLTAFIMGKARKLVKLKEDETPINEGC